MAQQDIGQSGCNQSGGNATGHVHTETAGNLALVGLKQLADFLRFGEKQAHALKL